MDMFEQEKRIALLEATIKEWLRLDKLASTDNASTSFDDVFDSIVATNQVKLCRSRSIALVGKPR